MLQKAAFRKVGRFFIVATLLLMSELAAAIHRKWPYGTNK
jgi:hypothetical protein